MNKLLKHLVVVIGAVVWSSCATDDIDLKTADEQSITVSFVLTTEDDVEVATRAISDGTSVDRLYYAVFTEDNRLILPKTNKRYISGITSSSGTNMTITLPAGRSYKAVFWAQSSQTDAYTLSDDMQLEVSYKGENNDEHRDAFYGVSELFAVDGSTVAVTLKRPFAQLNAGAWPFDWEWVKEYYGFEATQSAVVVRNVPNQLNLVDGTLSGEVNAYLRPGVMPEESLVVDVDEDGTPEEYTYLSMSYILADVTETTHSVDCFFLNDEGKAVTFNDTRLEAVALKRNCVTNFIGQVVSESGEINVRDYVDEPNTDYGYVYYNVEEDTTIKNTIYNMSSYDTGLQFASVSGQTITYNNLLFTGDIWTIELGEYRGGAYVNYNNVLNNVELRDLSASSCIECHEWYFSPATIAYGKTTLNNCVMKGATTIRDTVTDKHGVVHEVIPVDIGVRNESDAWFYGGEYGTLFAWTHAVVELYDTTIDTLYCGTCDSTKHSWMTIGSGTVIDRVICCEPRCPYGTKEYSTTMTIKSGAKVGSLQLVSTDVEFLIIEDGATVGTITCEGVEYTYEELRAAMGL